MNTLTHTQQVMVHALEPDEIAGNPHFRVYNYKGTMPDQSCLLLPHRKDHYLLVFIRKAGSRQWMDMTPYILRDNTIYFTTPNQVIVKEEPEYLWSTGIAFTPEFLSLQENAALCRLPLIQDLQNGVELLLSDADIVFVEDMLAKINAEYQQRSEWQQRMLTAYLTVLMTYLSRIYTTQFEESLLSREKQLLQQFQAQINLHFRALHEVNDYAAHLHISAKHLSEVVKLQSGKPAIKHIHERLVMEARRLLLHTNQSLKEIAFDLGFAEASYFNRFFKRETGSTPADYRSSIRKMYYAHR